ncbi:hypothetical protein HDE_09563 [Halotydeus destructor]|nr:hypothetical protein HDE_09563 [Halotydeus destructor]
MLAYLKHTPVRLAIPLDDSPFNSGAASLKYYSYVYKRANLTFQPLVAIGVGYRSPQGNYTGFLGQLVENVSLLFRAMIYTFLSYQRSDAAMFGTALKSFPFPNIVPGPVVSSLSLKIHSKMAEATKEQIDVLSSIQSLPLEFTVLVIAVVHTVVCCTLVTSTRPARGYLQGWWTSLRCFADQEDWNVERSSKRIVWLFFNGFVLVAVFGYILNLMSTDAFVLKQPRRLDTLEDVFDSFFAHVHFYLPKTSFFYNFVRESKRNTIMGKLYEKMENQSDCSQVSTCSFSEADGQLGSDSQLESLQVFQNLSQQGGGAGLMSDELRQELLAPAMCRLQPDMLTKLYTGLGVLAEDIFVYLVRANIDRQVDAYLRYFPTSLFEFHLIYKPMAEDLHNSLDTIRPEGRDLAYHICISRGDEEVLDVDIKVGIKAYKRMSVISVYIVSLASTVLPRRMETMRDVFDPYFLDRKIRYYLPTNDFFFNYVRDSKRGTAMRRLYDHMDSTKDCTQMETCNFIEVQTGTTDSTARFQKMIAMLQKKSEKDDSALFVTTELIEHCIIPAVCRAKPEWMEKLYTSPKAVVEDVMVTLQRADLGTEIGRYLRYKFSSLSEFGRFWSYVGDAVHLSVDRFSQGKDLRYYSCMARKMDTDVEVPARVKLDTYSALLTLSAYLVLLALVILLTEFLTQVLKITEALRRLRSSHARQLVATTRKPFGSTSKNN